MFARPESPSRLAHSSLRHALVAACVALGLALVTPPGAQAQSRVNQAASFLWLDVTQRACMERAVSSLDAANAQFRLGLRVDSVDGWYATLSTGDLENTIHCVADDGSENVVSARAQRVMVGITSVTTRADDVDSRILRFLIDCMKTGACARATAGGLGPTGLNGNWSGAYGGTYVFSQSGDTYRLVKSDGLVGEGRITGTSVEQWCVPDTCGRFTGRITVDSNGVATRIDFSNGDVYTRTTGATAAVAGGGAAPSGAPPPVAAGGASGSASASSGGPRFPVPMVNGVPVDGCATWATDCGQASADQFCRTRGYSSASSWTWARDERTWNIGSNRYCESGPGMECGGLRDVTCVGGGDGGRGPASLGPTGLDGNWSGAYGGTYQFSQSGNTYRLVRHDGLKAEGTITGNRIEQWCVPDTCGRYTGTITVDASGRATRIEFNNGDVYSRLP